MARSKGIIRIKGTIGNLTFYQRNGVEIVRVAGGPSAQQIRRQKTMRRQRENINEFYHGASPAAKVLRTGLVQMKHLWHADVSGRLCGLFRRIIGAEPGVPGQRPLDVRAHKEMLKHFSFHPERSFDRIVKFAYSIEANSQRTEVTLAIPAFDPITSLKVPGGTTHFRFLFGITVLSEYVFSRNASPYEPADKDSNGKHSFIASDFLSIKNETSPLLLNVALPDGVVPAERTAVIAALGIEFYQEVNGDMYRLKQAGCMKNLDVFLGVKKAKL